MRLRILAVAFLFSALGGLVALGHAPSLLSVWLVSGNFGVASVLAFAVDDDPEIVFRQLIGPTRPSTSLETQEIERPEYAVWHAVFDTIIKFDEQARTATAQGQDGTLHGDYFIRQGGLTSVSESQLLDAATSYLAEIKPLNERAVEITKDSGELSSDETQELNDTAIRYGRSIELSLGETTANNFRTFLESEFFKGTTIRRATTRNQPEGFIYDGFS